MRFGKWRATRLLAAVTLLASGCFGPFNLTRQAYKWNGSFSNKWASEGIYFVIGVPMYAITGLCDSLVFNSIEFWGGKNPIDPPSDKKMSLLDTDLNVPPVAADMIDVQILDQVALVGNS